MLKIDAPLGDLSLNEKPELTERFIQALDESGIDGPFRTLLTEHISENWKRVFWTACDLEDALKRTLPHTTDSEKCAAFLSAPRVMEKLSFELQTRHVAPGQKFVLFGFAEAVALSCFPASPYAFYHSVFELESGAFAPVSFWQFVFGLYGRDFCFSPALFGDEVLQAMGPDERNDRLWNFFRVMASQVDHQPDGAIADEFESRVKNVIAVASLELQPLEDLQGPPTRSTHEFLKGMKFLRTWVASDAESGLLANEFEGVFRALEGEWAALSRALERETASDNRHHEVLAAAQEWLNIHRIQLHETLYLHINLSSASEEERELWAKQLNYIFTRRTSPPDSLSPYAEEQAAAEGEYLIQLCDRLTAGHIEAWLRWSVRQDLSMILQSYKRTGFGGVSIGGESGKWWAAGLFDAWKSCWVEELSRLHTESKVAALSGRLRLETEAASRELQDWWKGLLQDLIQAREFPTQLIPEWTVAAIDRLDDEFLAPHIDKSIGLLRRTLSENGQPEHQKQLKQLLSRLEFLNSSKALRHRLMLMRSSPRPLADESVCRFSLMNDDNAADWYGSMEHQARVRWANTVNSRPGVRSGEYEHAELACYEAFSRDLVEFCLSRLRLRKGEKRSGDTYEAGQVTEQSPIWRQGYLKALLELGFDPQGKVHKAVFFTRQSDPDESVREVARECYRAVRRDSKKNPGLRDLKRGLIAAEWWLLMTQRLDLGLDVNYEKALRHRRALLRNP